MRPAAQRTARGARSAARRRGALVSSGALGALAALALAPTTARADSGLAVEAQARGGSLLVRSTKARNANTPSMLRSPTMRGSGAYRGLGLRVFGWDSNFRAGLAETFYWADDDAVELRTDPLPPGASTHTRAFFGGSLEMFLGPQGRLGPVTFYAELRMALHLLYLNTALRSTTLGFLGDTTFVGIRGDIGPRFGVTTKLGRKSYLDASVHTSPLGPEFFAASVGLGLLFR